MIRRISEKDIRLLLEVEDTGFSEFLHKLHLSPNLNYHMLRLRESGLLESPAHVHERVYPITPMIRQSNYENR